MFWNQLTGSAPNVDGAKATAFSRQKSSRTLMSRNLFRMGMLIVPNLNLPERMMESMCAVMGLERCSPFEEIKAHERRTRNGSAATVRIMVFSWRLERLTTPIGAILRFRHVMPRFPPEC